MQPMNRRRFIEYTAVAGAALAMPGGVTMGTLDASTLARSDETTFRGRRAIRLSNGRVELIALTGGGHIAAFRLLDSALNPLWEPPWPSIEPEQYDPARYPEYGTIEGRLLASIAGQTLALNHFGELSEAETAAGGYEHGEAPNLPWQVAEHAAGVAGAAGASLTYGLELPEAGVRFRRRIVLRDGAAIAHFDEEVENLRRSDSPLAYVQHVTLGPPFVEPGVTRLDLPGTRAHTFPKSFGEIDPLLPDREFTWPEGPGLGSLDVFPDRAPLCSVCTVALEPGDGPAFVAASNRRRGLLLAYVFPAEAFPWTALWYENRGLDYAPYNSRTVAWGLEFGTAALPESRIAMLSSGPLLGRPRFGVLPARATCRTAYDAMLVPIPPDWRGVAHIAQQDDQFLITERDGGRELRVGAEA